MPEALNTAPVLLVIFDGFGVNPSRLDNAWAQAKTPNLDKYFRANPHTVLQASGRAVGLPDGQFGNSEVGHLTIGAGRILEQDLLRIAEAINSGELEQHPVWREMLSGTRRLHMVGLVSDGGAHSHITHLLHMLPLVAKAGVEPVVHMITDGRDTPPREALKFLDELDDKFEEIGCGHVATVSGRYWAMDRAGYWDRTEQAWKAMVLGEGLHAGSARAAIGEAYNRGESDEFIQPTVIDDPSTPVIKADEPVLFFNYRNDRARQLVEAIGLPGFEHFDRHGEPPRSVVCITQYKHEYPFPVLFEPEYPADTLAEVISNAGLKQFHCAETEKFPHVTYFFNGGREAPFPGEERDEIPSPSVPTYDEMPEMSAQPVADRMIEAVNSGEYAFLLVNFANTDMVGHTAREPAVIKAVETLDREGGRLIEAALARGCRVMLTADHGNCDEMIDPATGEPQTQHSVYPVPFLLLGQRDAKLGIGRGVADIAPTILELLGLSRPPRMTGRSLILRDSLELEL